MSEIEKLYENTGIKKKAECSGCKGHIGLGQCNSKNGCINKLYPEFTAEKQLSLIKWLAKTRQVHITCLLDNWIIEGFVRYGKKYESFELALAGLINTLWQILTEAEKAEIKGILEK